MGLELQTGLFVPQIPDFPDHLDAFVGASPTVHPSRGLPSAAAFVLFIITGFYNCS